MEITFAFLIVALAAYVLFGGADFGGGLLEASLHRHPKLQHRLQATMGPVWEANHVWLIAVIVILFVGFPVVYARLLTALFVPVSIALAGIILRGSFFTFRKYDPEPENRSALYSVLFRASSALSPAMFGFAAAAILQPFPVATGDSPLTFSELYIQPWLTWMGLFCAIFVNALFAYLAAVFFYGEVSPAEDRAVIRTRIILFFAATFFSGGAVLAWGMTHELVNLSRAFTPLHLLIHAAAFAGIIWMIVAIRRNRTWQMRLAAGVQTLAILGNWHHIRYPVMLAFDDGTILTVRNSAAPAVTIFWLNIGLVVVLALVLPLLVYLYRVFQDAPDTQA